MPESGRLLPPRPDLLLAQRVLFASAPAVAPDAHPSNATHDPAYGHSYPVLKQPVNAASRPARTRPALLRRRLDTTSCPEDQRNRLTEAGRLSMVETLELNRQLNRRCLDVKSAGVCCDRCPGASTADTSHFARRRLLKAAVFQPQPGPLNVAETPAAYPPARSASEQADGTGRGGPGELGERRPTIGRMPHDGRFPGEDRRSVTARGTWPPALRADPDPVGRRARPWRRRSARIDARRRRRFALTADATAWRGEPLEPSALAAGDEAVIRIVPAQSGIADRIWANIGRVCGTILECDSERMLVAECAIRQPQTVVISPRARVRIRVKLPNLRPGYLVDIIGVRRGGVLNGLIATSPQPPYRSDHLRPLDQSGSRTPDAITGSAVWHDSREEPYGVLGVFYPAVDPAAGCVEDTAAGITPGRVQTFRELPYLAIGSALHVRNECTGIGITLPVTGCAPTARLFNDHCIACKTSPRGRIADLTLASFVALGGELEQGCFNATLTIGR